MRYRATVAVVDLDAVRRNVGALKPERAEVMAVVKANGYGHGDVQVARAALEAGATWLGVAMVEEGLRLRDHGFDVPVFVLTELPPGSEKEAVTAGLTPCLYSEEGLARLADAAGSTGDRVGVHVKVDTGMHRVGVGLDRAESFVRKVLDAGLRVEGLWTHLAKAEDLDDPFTEVQLSRFEDFAGRLSDGGIRPRYLHAANSAATVARPRAQYDLVRLGVAMYGLSPWQTIEAVPRLSPVLSLRSAVGLVKRVGAGERVGYGLTYVVERESTIVTVPIGYADGYHRLLSNRGEVLIRGRRHPVAGAVSMDQITVDCGDGPVEEGDEVVLIGTQGGERISAEELARHAGTINYEITCGLSARVPREYVG